MALIRSVPYCHGQMGESRGIPSDLYSLLPAPHTLYTVPMSKRIAGSEIERLIQLLAKVPGLGPRSARRAVLHLIKKKEQLMVPLAGAIAEAVDKVRVCSTCGNVDTSDPCSICSDPRRDGSVIIVVEDVADLWALERASAMNARYHVLGGTLSPLDG